MDTESRIIEWIVENKGVAPEVIKNSDLIESRILDSMQFLDFIMFINEIVESDVSSQISVETLRRVDSITEFVNRRVSKEIA
ncbi:hypothetical protein [Variovorax sp. N23]|uniref:hypothetical protein n=1 Tax=Variovorax sp. N23 TaxID=2980555 RepID=UPI0021CAD472|nr:hypothetical protein [Variovorax sp. N23]MCU4120437.1 hypothetical protein [Variovorax sp. N23]